MEQVPEIPGVDSLGAPPDDAWSAAHRFGVTPDHCYVTPMYGITVTDPGLLAFVERDRARHIVIAIGAGAQEKLGK